MNKIQVVLLAIRLPLAHTRASLKDCHFAFKLDYLEHHVALSLAYHLSSFESNFFVDANRQLLLVVARRQALPYTSKS